MPAPVIAGLPVGTHDPVTGPDQGQRIARARSTGGADCFIVARPLGKLPVGDGGPERDVSEHPLCTALETGSGEIHRAAELSELPGEKGPQLRGGGFGTGVVAKRADQFGGSGFGGEREIDEPVRGEIDGDRADWGINSAMSESAHASQRYAPGSAQETAKRCGSLFDMDRPAVRDAALLILRTIVGVVFVAHGYDRMFLTGITETTGQFSAWGIPQPQLSAYLVTGVELLGGALLVLGLLTTFIAGALLLVVGAAGYFVHLTEGFFVADNGVEFVAVLAAALLIVIVFGPGRASLDGALT